MAKNYKIMLVDDDFIFLEMLKESLTDINNIEIETAKTGEECLKKLNSTFDILVLDYFLNAENPNAKNGLEILKAVRQFHPSIKIVILSGQEDGNLVYEFVRENVDNYVVKDNNAFENVHKAIDSIMND
ncbi:MAG: response regulator [Salinivirgaceae bacterium]|nr:response regulator [Salinivirgaceae bacterium]MDD4745645.1 response regulator [Salinivirgaceae bacterium]MDY0279293.1 response regulator [Salinivirgaceae bacterium]